MVVPDPVLPPMLISCQRNILVQIVNNVPRALIADFGLATVTRNPDSIRPATRQPHHTALWTAPEVLEKEKENPSKESDIYSFAMLMIEVRDGRSTIEIQASLAYRCLVFMKVFTNGVPFRGEGFYKAIAAVLDGKRPPRPDHPSCTDRLWNLIQHCWNHDPQLRPKAKEVSQVLSDALN